MFRLNSAAAAASASHGPGPRSRSRPVGVEASQISTPGPRKSAEYLERAASPADTPAASHQAAVREDATQALNAHQRVKVQNRAAGASGTARKPPAATSSMALNHTAARAAVRRSAPVSYTHLTL